MDTMLPFDELWRQSLNSEALEAAHDESDFSQQTLLTIRRSFSANLKHHWGDHV